MSGPRDTRAIKATSVEDRQLVLQIMQALEDFDGEAMLTLTAGAKTFEVYMTVVDVIEESIQ